MRTIPIDMSRLELVATGKVAPKAEYVELSDGSRRASGNQVKDEASGLPLWTVDVLVDDDDARRAEIVGVTVPAVEEPSLEKYRPVRFINATARIYVDRASGQARTSLVADGIDTGSGKSGPKSVAPEAATS